VEHSSSTRRLSVPTDAPFDGDPTWRVTRTLADGSAVTIRPITPDDRLELRRGFQAMTPRSRYLRFLGITTDLSESTLTYLTCVDQRDHVALVAEVASPDLKTEHGVGVARFIRLAGRPSVAEAAITVVDEWQKRGIGTLLAIELGRAAFALGVRTIRAEVLADNAMMIAILEAAGAKHVTAEDGTVSYDLALEAAPAAPLGERFARVLRGAAETLGLTIRQLLPSGGAAPTGDDDGGRSEREPE
jgi:RimJ/RimL family protein N-acetyltransferase